MVEYSVASVSYNMSETIEESLKAILNQIDDRFEVFLFDESNDGSIEILKELGREYDNFRFEHIEPDPEIHIGKAWNISIRNSRGEHVLLHLDMDDKYKEGTIKDFVRIYEKLRENVNHPFYFCGTGISVVQKGWFLNEVGGHENIERWEDKEIWRRLMPRGEIIWLDNELPFEKIGYYRDLWEKYKVAYRGFKSAFEQGETPLSELRWCFTEPKYISLIPAVFVAHFSVLLRGEKGELDSRFKNRMYFREKIKELKKTLPELEQKYNFKVKKEKLNCEEIWL